MTRLPQKPVISTIMGFFRFLNCKSQDGQHRFWFTGDMEAVGETLLLNQGQLQPISVLKVGHHGSRTSSGEEFLRALAPQYAIISVGYGNRFGHPHPEALRRLTTRGIDVYRTDRDGAVIFYSDGKTLAVEKFIQEGAGE